MTTRFFIPGPLKDTKIETFRIGDDWSARAGTGLTVSAKSEKAATLKLARHVFKHRQNFGLVGAARLRSMKDCQNRLEALTLTSSTDDEILAWRIRAKALGCQALETHGLDGWSKELEARTGAVRAYVERTSVAGVLGRPGVHYPLILADPPWLYNDQGTRLAPEYAGAQRKVKAYSALPLPEILALGEHVKDAVAENALLFLWVPASLVVLNYHGMVSRAWGFEPKTLIPWIKMTQDGTKPRIGGGHYVRAVHEELTVATRGDLDAYVDGERLVIASRGRGAATIVNHSVPGVISAPRTEHSAKPDEQYALIDALVGDVPKLELFARRARDGYDAWGDEA